MKTCPFFGKCGGCKYDFAAADYRPTKAGVLRGMGVTGGPIWVAPGERRRAEFCFAGGMFGFFAPGSKDIVPITHCPGVVDGINAVLPDIAALPMAGAGGALVTQCDNGIDLAITSDVSYFPADFKKAVEKLPLVRVTWNGSVVIERAVPTVTFGDRVVPYPAGAFLQPGVSGADALRDLVVSRAAGAKKVADLFCGLGNFTFALNADGYDVVGTGTRRDLFRHPLMACHLRHYDCVVLDPPRSGAMAQCRELSRSNVARVIYVSCNPITFMRDRKILEHGGYRKVEMIPVDQFVGSAHWEIFAVFDKHPA